MDTSEAYLEQFGPSALVAELVAEFNASELLPHQVQICGIPWKQIYTTNYDNVVEKCFLQSQRSLETINPDMNVNSIPKDRAVCIHLNGSIIDITTESLASQIKLTDTSYLTSSIADTEWAVRFRQDIDAAQAVFYIGYSTYDIDIARLLFAKPSLKQKSFFVLGDSVSQLLGRRVEKFGFDTHLSAETFGATVSDSQFAPAGKSEPPEYCLRTYKPDLETKRFEDEDVYDLFMLGRLSQPLLFNAITGSIPYAVLRKPLQTIMGIISDGPSATVVHSVLGNGKTILLETLKVEAFRSGFTVIELIKQAESLFEELEFVLTNTGRLLFLIDNYGNWMDAIRFIGMHHRKNISVVLASRTTTHDILAARVQQILNLGNLQEIAIDRMKPEDVLRVAQLMDTYGLWGRRAGLSIERKTLFLSNTCSGAWHAILLSLFEAPQIKNRLDKLVADIRDESTFNLILVTIMVLAIIDYPSTTDVLTDLCGERTLSVSFRQNRTVRELVDFERDEVRLRSAVTGAYLLRSVADPETTLASLITITRAADNGAFVSREYQAILVSLVRFGNAQNFFPENDRNRTVIRYYEAIKELAHCRKSPLFWLQYAIACLFLNDFGRAGTFFKTAYSLAASQNFNTFQIDNHYARYLLIKNISNGDAAEAMDGFRNARRLIYEQIRRERLHYPFRVAALIGDWFDAFSDRINNIEKEEVKRAAAFICSRISALPEIRQKHKDVAECYRKLQLIVQES